MTLAVVDMHKGGEPLRIVTGGSTSTDIQAGPRPAR